MALHRTFEETSSIHAGSQSMTSAKRPKVDKLGLSALQFTRTPHEHSLCGVNLACDIS
jgi:hypothetical protein